MKFQPIHIIMAAVCAGALGSCAARPTATKVLVSKSLEATGSSPARLLQEVNSYRRSRGIHELQRHAGLDHLAQQHCEYLRQHRGSFTLNGKNVSHMGFEGRALVARERHRISNISENVAAANHGGVNPAPILLGLWKTSKGHHQNLLNSWTHTGVGVVTDADGMVFATELFATVTSSQMTMRNRFNKF